MAKKKVSFRYILLTYVVLFCIFSVAITTLFLSLKFNSLIKQELVNSTTILASSISSEIEKTFRYYEHFLQSLAQEVYVELSSQNAISYNSFRGAIREQPGFESIRLLDGNLRVRASFPFKREEIGTDLSGHPYIKESILKHISWSQVYLSVYSGRPVISIAVSFELGVLVADINLDFVQETIRARLPIPYLQVIVVDGFGNLIAHPDISMVQQRLNFSYEAIVSQALKGEEIAQEFLLMGKECIGSGRRLDFNNWVIIAAVPKEIAFKGIGPLLLWVLIIVVIVSSFAVMGGWQLVKRVLLPVDEILKTTRLIKEGRFEVVETKSPYYEFAEIQGALMDMAKSLLEREEALKESEIKYKDLVENAPDPILLLDTDGKIVDANQAVFKRGYKKEEVIGKHITELMAEEFHHLFYRAREKLLRGEWDQFELRSREKDGSSKWYSVSVRPILGKEGGINLAQCIARDITELKATEALLRESESRYRLLYESVSDLIYTQDLEGRIVNCNPALSRLFGYEPDEFVGRKVSDFMEPKFREAFETEYLRRLVNEGELEGITAYFTKDGSKIYIAWKSKLVRPPSGQPFITGIGRDVTESFLAQKRLKVNEATLRAIFDTAPIPMAVYDGKGEIVSINMAFTKVFGWEPKEAVGRKLPELPQEEVEKVIIERSKVIQTGSIHKLEGHRYTKDGRLLDVEMYASAILEAGVLKWLVVAFHDVTEQKRMLKALQHSEKMEALGTLAGGIAHNFNNILMGIQGNIQLLKMKFPKDHPDQKRFNTLLTLINDGANLTRQLLGLSKPTKWELKPTDINELIREHDRVFKQTRKDVEIVEDLEARIWKVQCDRNQMKQVLMNLYINAVQAMEEMDQMQGQPFRVKCIMVSTKNVTLSDRQLGEYQVSSGDFVKVSVKDFGIGMDEKTKKRIFEPFFTTKGMGKGTGLGLSSVYGIVKNHGGYIEVESKTMEGSTFHIFLPRLSEVEEFKAASEKQLSIHKGSGKILLVDDEQFVLEAARDMLLELGYEVIATPDPKEALNILEQEKGRIDLVIVDMIMPKMSGIELAKAIREKDLWVKIMISSGYALEEELQKGADLRISGTIHKPYSIESLSTEIKKVLMVREGLSETKVC